MGGNVFRDSKGNPLTTTIKREDVDSTLEHLFQAVLRPIGITEYVKLGSTGKKAESGDLDIAIGIGDADKTKFKKEFIEDVQQILSPERAKVQGQLGAIMYPIVDKGTGNLTDDNVQIDVMFTATPSHTEWMMSGTGEGVKGVYRNLMLAHIAKQRSLAQQDMGNDIKLAISFPGGLQVTRGKEIVVPRTNKPQEVLKLLGIEAEPSEVETFEKLVDHMAKISKLKAHLSTFEDYIRPYLERDSENANLARDYVNSTLSVQESLRTLIRGLLLSEGASNQASEEAMRMISGFLEPIRADSNYKIIKKGNEIKILSDERQEIFDLLLSKLEPSGFVHNPLQGGSLGRIERKDGRHAVYIVVKPMSSAGRGASVGQEYEENLAKAINDISDDIEATTAGFGHGSDLTIKTNKATLKIEAKTSLGADFGQFSMSFNALTNKWEPIETKGFNEHKDVFLVVADLLASSLPAFDFYELGTDVFNWDGSNITGLKASRENVEHRKVIEKNLFNGKSDIKIPFDFDNVSSYYSSKGDEFIQIRGKGLYALKDSSINAEIKAPLFSDAGLAAEARFRLKPSGGALGTFRFVVGVKLKGRLRPSSISLDSKEDVMLIISTLS